MNSSGVAHRLAEMARGVVELLREIGDETAYRRHLAGLGREHSPAEWRAFSDERMRRKYVRPKCC